MMSMYESSSVLGYLRPVSFGSVTLWTCLTRDPCFVLLNFYVSRLFNLEVSLGVGILLMEKTLICVCAKLSGPPFLLLEYYDLLVSRSFDLSR